MLDIFEVLDDLERVETLYRNNKEALLTKEDYIYLHEDWNVLKKERGISNQRQREAYVRECTQELREQVTTLQLERDNLKRTYTALLWMNKPDIYTEQVEE